MGLQEYFAQLSRGVDLVAECSGLSAPDLEKMGASAQDAAELISLHTIYFGTTPYTVGLPANRGQIVKRLLEPLL
ncbi:MAG: hypothetical protein L0J16_04855, partial [Corynebacterium flavescens]|nr:hypothetical protein [Corynebacterium flavescens]